MAVDNTIQLSRDQKLTSGGVSDWRSTSWAAGGWQLLWLWSFPTKCLVVLSVLKMIEGAPILGPDLNTCEPIIPFGHTAADPVVCCLEDTGKPIVNFKHNPDLPMRIRRPVHKLDDAFVSKYERAMELMRALPDHDPLSWHAQSNLHCIYGAGSTYRQTNSSEKFEVHFTWFTLPFHRWMVYFHERILGSLIGDDTFAIPYWAWDVQNETSPPANILSDIFGNSKSPLFDLFRNEYHHPPNVVDLNFQMYGPTNYDLEELKLNNYYVLWRTMISDTPTSKTFFGGKVSLGESIPREEGAGVPEMGPHGSVHLWTGDQITKADMGISYTGAKDPIFYAHHAQMDRVWGLWERSGGRVFDDPDWLDTEFILYDENADLVRVKVRDSLDISKLRYSYEEIPVDWLDFTPQSIRATNSKYAPRGKRTRLQKLWTNFLHGEVIGNLASLLGLLGRRRQASEVPVTATAGRAIVTSRVPRPKITNKSIWGNDVVYKEVLVLRGVVTKPFDVEVRFKIFVELPEADESTTLACVESMGTFHLEAEGRNVEETIVTRGFSHMIGLGSERLRILDLHGESSLVFTFVPAWDPRHDADISIQFTDLKLELHEGN